MTSNSSGPARWEKRGVTTLAKTRVLDVNATRYHHPSRATERDFVVVSPPDWVNVVALTPDARIVLVRQFRFGIDDFSLEIPGGVMDPGEEPIAAGLRELEEETGFVGRSPRILGCVHPNPAIQSNRCHFVFVEHAVASREMAWDPDEEIEVTTLPVAEVLDLAHRGGIKHALVLDALFFFERIWRSGDLRFTNGE